MKQQILNFLLVILFLGISKNLLAMHRPHYSEFHAYPTETFSNAKPQSRLNKPKCVECHNPITHIKATPFNCDHDFCKDCLNKHLQLFDDIDEAYYCPILNCNAAPKKSGALKHKCCDYCNSPHSNNSKHFECSHTFCTHCTQLLAARYIEHPKSSCCPKQNCGKAPYIYRAVTASESEDIASSNNLSDTSDSDKPVNDIVNAICDQCSMTRIRANRIFECSHIFCNRCSSAMLKDNSALVYCPIGQCKRDILPYFKAHFPDPQFPINEDEPKANNTDSTPESSNFSEKSPSIDYNSVSQDKDNEKRDIDDNDISLSTSEEEEDEEEMLFFTRYSTTTNTWYTAAEMPTPVPENNSSFQKPPSRYNQPRSTISLKIPLLCAASMAAIIGAIRLLVNNKKNSSQESNNKTKFLTKLSRIKQKVKEKIKRIEISDILIPSLIAGSIFRLLTTKKINIPRSLRNCLGKIDCLNNLLHYIRSLHWINHTHFGHCFLSVTQNRHLYNVGLSITAGLAMNYGYKLFSGRNYKPHKPKHR